VTGMDEERTTPADVEALPIEARAAAYLEAQQRLEARLELPGA
jgi:hypothetical protein